MQTLSALITFLLTLACPLCFAQDAPKAPSRYAAPLVPQVNADADLTAQMSEKRQQIETTLRGYLVAFNASHDGGHRVHVGLPLASFANNLVHVAYDVADSSVMMQWNFSELTHRGTEWKFNAFLSQSKTAAIAVSANF